MMNIFLGWLLGVASSAGAAVFMYWLMALDVDRKNEPPTKEEWKVM